ncbi:hypothetical protein GGS20DRAFT_558990 [Poronia punctata]|nr:hypothetical protein GGS20DRAFT_558990 [Poronia punctata]
MHAPTILATLLGASSTIVMAAPTWPHIKWDVNKALGGGGRDSAISEYFNLLAQKIDTARFLPQAPLCDLSNAHIPTVSKSPLPPPTAGLKVKHVAIGRGTQNYTCPATSPSSSPPVAAGAVATLFNASCVASTYPDLLHVIPRLALYFDLDLGASVDALNAQLNRVTRLGPTNLDVSGKHFFTNATTPFFNLDTSRHRIGEAPCSKTNATDAPEDAPKGRNGEKAVPWLRLATNEQGTTGGIHEVYRVQTVGGSAPETCEGQPEAFTVQYAAEYWFYAES